MFKFNALLVFWCAVMIMQPSMGEGLRVKRSHSPAPPAVDAITAKAVATTLATAVTSQATSSGTAAGTAKAVATGANTTNPPAVVTAGPTVATTTTETATNSTESSLGPRLVGDLLSALQHARRRLSLMNDELTRNKRSHASTGVPPGTAARAAPLSLQPLGLLSLMNNAPIARRYHAAPRTASSAPLSSPFGGYYSKTILPDGNTEMEEFELVSPNLMTEMTDNGVQQELDFAPKMMLGHIMAPAKYHQQYKSSPALPPMLDMFQQLLQSNPTMEQSPLFQFINRAEDMTLQNIPKVIDHILVDGLGLEIDDQLDEDTNAKDNENKDKDKKDGKSKLLDVSKKDELKNGKPNQGENEIVISCPVRHEQHANRNGKMVDDDIVLVDQCHVV
ncbi:uncharacterized protein LOC111075558 [Drosophila obscura]|uniref:uncharacterized protein LOC111075558 n=1 Tax=Drosophila obscura TaxID=7282 RepID=UPI001BB28D98|nr:uncharacterized protein LOC111075558 [Drosophila obscura]